MAPHRGTATTMLQNFIIVLTPEEAVSLVLLLSQVKNPPSKEKAATFWLRTKFLSVLKWILKKSCHLWMNQENMCLLRAPGT